jgi:integrase/recombinase XerD
MLKSRSSRERAESAEPKTLSAQPASEKSRNAKPEPANPTKGDPAVVENGLGFATPFAITKLEAIKRLVSLARRAHLDYEGLRYVLREARRQLGLQRASRKRKLPHLLTPEELRAFFAAVDAAGDLRHSLMLRLLYTTGVRVSELVHLKRGDVDLAHLTIRVEQGKGGKDRNVLIPAGLRFALGAYMEVTPANTYLFETRHCGAFTTRRVEQIVAAYGSCAKLGVRVHPHLFRHQALTELTRAGLTDAQIQVLSGHASKKSLEVYQHLGLAAVADDYQRAMREQLP